MSDQKAADISSWVLEILASLIVAAGIGSATMLKGWRARIDARLDCLAEGQSQHSTALAVIHANQDNLTKRLDEIRETTQDCNQKLDVLVDTTRDR